MDEHERNMGIRAIAELDPERATQKEIADALQHLLWDMRGGYVYVSVLSTNIQDEGGDVVLSIQQLQSGEVAE